MPNTPVIPITFLIKESITNTPIYNAFISVWTSDLTSLLIPTLITDVYGQVVAGLTQGDYAVVVYADGHSFRNPLYFSVTSDNPFTTSILGDPTILDPNIVGQVVLYGYVKDVSGRPMAASEVKIRINPAPQYTKANVIAKQDYTIKCDEQGYFETILLGGLKVTVTVPDCNFQLSGVLPPSGKIDITKLDKQPTVL